MMAFWSMEFYGLEPELLMGVMGCRYQVLKGHRPLVLYETLLSCHEWNARPMSLLAATVVILHCRDAFNVFLAANSRPSAVSMHSQLSDMFSSHRTTRSIDKEVPFSRVRVGVHLDQNEVGFVGCDVTTALNLCTGNIPMGARVRRRRIIGVESKLMEFSSILA